jgi:drug/metabolite transporter (DMT)-like permease
MPSLAIASFIGFIVSSVIQARKSGSLSAVFRLPPKLIVSSFLGISVYTVVLAIAFGAAPDKDLGLVSLGNYLWPVWIILLSRILLPVRKPLYLVLIACGLGFAGLAVVRGWSVFQQPPASLWPVLASVIGGFLWALYSVLLKRWNIREDQNASCLAWLFTSVLAGIVGIINGEWTLMPPLKPEAVLWMLYYGIGPIGLAYSWWETGMKKGPHELLGFLSFFIPVLSTLLLGVFFRESLSAGLLPGALMVSVAAVLGSIGTRKLRT